MTPNTVSIIKEANITVETFIIAERGKAVLPL